MKRQRNPVLRFFMMLGPGLITGASDDDPSGIGTYSQAGALLGYATLWMAWVTFPLMAAVQYICAKVGLVTGRGLAGVLREHYPKALLYPVVFLLLAANTINAGVDIGAVAAGLNLLIPIPIGVFVPVVVAVILGLQIWGSYRLIANTFKWLTLALFAYIASSFCSHPDLYALSKGALIPTIHFNGRSWPRSSASSARRSRPTSFSGRPVRKWKKKGVAPQTPVAAARRSTTSCHTPLGT